MSDLQKRKPGEMAHGEPTGMLKHQSPQQFKELLMAMVVKCIKLNMEEISHPSLLQEMVEELYDLLQVSWPGAKPSQLWATLKYGMAKQGQYRVRINYPTLANWILYHRQLKTETEGAGTKNPGVPIDTQVNNLLTGLSEYRKRVESGAYKPKGREDLEE